jgi:DNA-binding CsgD family transcriptional regulator
MRAGMPNVQHTLPPSELSRLIGLIYDCALDRERWPAALHEIRSALDFANAAITVLSLREDRVVLNALDGIDPYWVGQMPRFGADAVEQWGGAERIATFPLDRPLVLSRTTPRSEWMGKRFYLEWGKPQGLHDSISMPLAIDRTIAGSLAMGRHVSKGEIGETEVEVAGLLLPHVQRAVAISKILDFHSLATATFAGALDQLAVGVILVDAEAAIFHANAAAQVMLAAGSPVRADKGRLRLRPEAVNTALIDALHRAAAADLSTMGRRGTGIPLVRDGSTPLALYVLPLRPGALLPGLASGAVASIFIAPAVTTSAVEADMLAALFDLTSAEARVFSEIAAGKTRAEAARSLGIEENTVKTHLAHIFTKTGTRRQADLVALNASLSLPL